MSSLIHNRFIVSLFSRFCIGGTTAVLVSLIGMRALLPGGNTVRRSTATKE